MSSNYATLGVVLLLVFAGCSMLPGGDGGDGGAVGSAPSHHELIFASDVDTFEATVTVEKDGEQVYQRNVSEEDGLFVNLTALDDPGPYTVTVDTDVQVGGDPMSEQLRIPADAGNATVIELDFASISTTRYTLPREELVHPLGSYSSFQTLDEDSSKTLEVEVSYRGEMVGKESMSIPQDDLQRVLELNRTGVYTVRARTDGDWKQESVVITNPDRYIRIDIGARGDVSKIYVKRALEWG